MHPFYYELLELGDILGRYSVVISFISNVQKDAIPAWLLEIPPTEMIIKLQFT